MSGKASRVRTPAALGVSYGAQELFVSVLADDGTLYGSASPDRSQVSTGAILHSDGSLELLPSLVPGAVSIVFDIDSVGTSAGRSSLVPTPFWLAVPSEAVLWTAGTPIGIGTLGGFYAEARRINDAGLVIGASNTATSDFARGFVWDAVGGMREITPAEPGGLGHVSDLGADGVISGYATVGGLARACLWPGPDAPPELLPRLPGDHETFARAHDGTGSVVGDARMPAGTTSARLWWQGQPHALDELVQPPLPVQLATAIDVDELGRILVRGAFDPTHGFVHVRLDPVPSLAGAPADVSLAAGGSHVLELAAGPACAHDVYLVLGSTSGTEPGVPLGDLVLALVPDSYTNLTLVAPNQPPLASTLGVLDASGTASAAIVVPAGSNPTLAGLVFHHAFLALDAAAAGLVTFASDPVSLTLEP